MKITRRQLRRIIKEEMSEKEWKGRHERKRKAERGNNVTFSWDRSGLAMGVYVDGRGPVLEFYTQKQVTQLIKQLEDLLAGPMRPSP